MVGGGPGQARGLERPLRKDYCNAPRARIEGQITVDKTDNKRTDDRNDDRNRSSLVSGREHTRTQGGEAAFNGALQPKGDDKGNVHTRSCVR